MNTGAATTVDRLWSNALGRILPESSGTPLRPGLGDQIDLFILQMSTSRLVSTNPGFARVLYTAAYDSAERNGYFVIRRLGMPADFFWKFDQWSEDRALKTLRRVVDRIFSALLERHNAGRLVVESVDLERGRFELSFADCAECRGTSVSRPGCFFHAGTFAGIIASMLNRPTRAVEVSCSGTSDGPCRFLISEQGDRRIEADWNKALDAGLLVYSALPLAVGSNEERVFVDVGYYQLLLGTAFLPNLDVLQAACLDAGRTIGHDIAEQLVANESVSSVQTVRQLFADLRYMDIEISERDGETYVRANDAPESFGPLSDAAVVPFFCGELESLLNDLGNKTFRFESVTRDGDSVLLRFIPEV